MNKKKFGLALGSGGAMGIAHVGFLEVLLENGIEPDVIAGSSIGSVVGSLYANGFSVERMVEMIGTLRQDDIVDFDLFFLSKLSLNRGKKVEKLLKDLLGEQTQFSDLGIPFGCVAVDLLSCSKVYLTEGEVWKAVLASTAIPSAFPPVEMDDMFLVDGGIMDRVPGELCRQLGADVVVGVDVMGAPVKNERPKNMFKALVSAYRITEYELTKLLTSNVDHMVELVQPDVSPFKVKNLQESYAHGKKAAEDNLEKIKELID